MVITDITTTGLTATDTLEVSLPSAALPINESTLGSCSFSDISINSMASAQYYSAIIEVSNDRVTFIQTLDDEANQYLIISDVETGLGDISFSVVYFR